MSESNTTEENSSLALIMRIMRKLNDYNDFIGILCVMKIIIPIDSELRHRVVGGLNSAIEQIIPLIPEIRARNEFLVNFITNPQMENIVNRADSPEKAINEITTLNNLIKNTDSINIVDPTMVSDLVSIIDHMLTIEELKFKLELQNQETAEFIQSIRIQFIDKFRSMVEEA